MLNCRQIRYENFQLQITRNAFCARFHTQDADQVSQHGGELHSRIASEYSHLDPSSTNTIEGTQTIQLPQEYSTRYRFPKII